MSDELTEHAIIQNWRVIAYGLATTLIILAGSILAWVEQPSKQETCSRSCGTGRFLAWTAERPAYTQPQSGFSPNLVMPPVAEKCECRP